VLDFPFVYREGGSVFRTRVISSSNASQDTGPLLPRGPAAIGALKLVLAPTAVNE
jgi:hypothetical protein